MCALWALRLCVMNSGEFLGLVGWGVLEIWGVNCPKRKNKLILFLKIVLTFLKGGDKIGLGIEEPTIKL